MSRSLDHLCPRFRLQAFELLARCAEERVWCLVIDTLRTPVEQAEYLRTGASKTLASLHLPQTHCGLCGHVGGLSHAMDAAPIKDMEATNVVKAIQWDTTHRSWAVYGRIAKKLGLTWGGDWRTFKDFSHVQLSKLTEET